MFMIMYDTYGVVWSLKICEQKMTTK